MKDIKMIFNLIVTAALLASCGGSFIIPEPVKKPDDGGHQTETPKIPVVEPGNGKLVADGNDADTYTLIRESGYNYETPDESGAHSVAPFRHITQSYDDFLQRYVFNFILHIENDDDRGLANVTDRQRNEIKTDGKSPASMVAAEGECLKISWKFMLPANMVTTGKFAHVHQLKGIDNAEGNADVSMPLITYTVRTMSNGKQQFQVIFNGPTGIGPQNEYLARTDLNLFTGHWVEVNETVRFAESGNYELTIKRLDDGKELVRVSRTGLNLWRSGTTGMRPKWGLYRSFGSNGSLKSEMRDETLRFADFSIEKL